MTALLEVTGITKSFGGIKALNGVSFEVGEREIVGLIGPNGSGKTTLFEVINGFYAPDHGSIRFQGRELTQLAPYEIAKAGIGRTFQLVRLFPKLTVLDNLLVAEQHLKGELLLHALLKVKSLEEEEKRCKEKALELLQFVELEGKKHELAENLSYGQQKLLEIARALALNPKLILLDEPDAGLNPTIAKKVFNVVKELKRQGKSVLMIEHDMETVMGLCDRVIVLDFGEKIAEGTPKEIRANTKVLEAYLGRVRK